MKTSTIVQRFWEDGFVPVDNLLDPALVEALNQRTDEILNGSVPFPQQFIHLEPEHANGPLAHIDRALVVRKISNLVLHDSLFGTLLEHPKVLSTVTAILGPDVKLLNDQMLCKPARYGSAKPYHQDSPYWPIEPMEHLTMWIALDDATPENGCLRYLKGSHKNGPLPHDDTLGYHRMPEGWRDLPGSPEEVMVPIPAGSCICHHSLVLHETAPNTTWSRRRGLSVVFMKATARWTSDSPQPKFRLVAGKSHEGCI
jgi:ectoine hydroxylase-related dioxygenase (phytanoyl-CoA dioxygenase family)